MITQFNTKKMYYILILKCTHLEEGVTKKQTKNKIAKITNILY